MINPIVRLCKSNNIENFDNKKIYKRATYKMVQGQLKTTSQKNNFFENYKNIIAQLIIKCKANGFNYICF